MSEMKVELVGYTLFEPADVPWIADAGGGQALAEFAGRACYQSWTKPNPATATNEGYLKHIIESGHHSVLEHGSASFYITGVSRSLTHELVRHRLHSYSQLSQRYVDESKTEFVVPDVIADDPDLLVLFNAAVETARTAYKLLVTGLEAKFASVENATDRRKLARQAARSVLPNATETKIVMSGNYRSWRHFIEMRNSPHADVEIRQLAQKILSELKFVAPNIFDDL